MTNCNHKSALTQLLWLDSRRHDQATKSKFSVGDSPANHVPAGPSDRIVRAFSYMASELRENQAIMAQQVAEIENLLKQIALQRGELAAPALVAVHASLGARERCPQTQRERALVCGHTQRINKSV